MEVGAEESDRVEEEGDDERTEEGEKAADSMLETTLARKCKGLEGA